MTSYALFQLEKEYSEIGEKFHPMRVQRQLPYNDGEVNNEGERDL